MHSLAIAPPHSGGCRNDVHSGLNATIHTAVCTPTSIGEVSGLLQRAGKAGQRLAVAGAMHAMGGQQFVSGGWLLDTSRMDRVLGFDATRGLLRVGAGIRWPALQRFLVSQRERDGSGWAIAQKQTGADDFSLGGALASNIHGRGLDRPPFVDDLQGFTLVTPGGEVRHVDRHTDAELFALAVGGYGMFGVVTDLTLRLQRRCVLERRVTLLRRECLAAAFSAARAEGACFGDFQFAVDPLGPDFLDLGVFTCYLPGSGEQTAAPRHLSPADWRTLLHLAHVDKSEAFRRYSRFYLSSDGQRYGSDDHQFGVYLDGYHAALDQQLGHRGSEMITELYVPLASIDDFLATLAEDARRHGLDIVYGTVRLIRADLETRLAWARQDWACVVLNLHVAHAPAALARHAADQQRLIDHALAFGGSFYLTYHRHARADQLRAAYPGIDAVFADKRRIDPAGVLHSDWYAAMAATLGLPA